MAERGCSLEEVTSGARNVASNIGRWDLYLGETVFLFFFHVVVVVDDVVVFVCLLCVL